MTEQAPNGPDNEETTDTATRTGGMEGEGSYTGAREFNQAETGFVQNNREEIEAKAREAAEAVDSPEGAELEQAEEQTRARGEGMGEV